MGLQQDHPLTRASYLCPSRRQEVTMMTALQCGRCPRPLPPTHEPAQGPGEHPLVLTCQQQVWLIYCVLSVGFSFVFLPLFSQMKYTPNQSKFPETAGWSFSPCFPNYRTAPVHLLFQEPVRPCRSWSGADAACGQGRPLPHSAPGPMWLVSRFWGGGARCRRKSAGGPLVPIPFSVGPCPPPNLQCLSIVTSLFSFFCFAFV